MSRYEQEQTLPNRTGFFSQRVFLPDCAFGAANDFNPIDYFFDQIIIITGTLASSVLSPNFA